MKFNSPLFDKIRVKPGEDRRARVAEHVCEWPGCPNEATHRAPKGRGREKDYWRYCLDHVRQYNQNYNFFQGMSDDDVRKYQKDALTGHRPTWKMGTGNKMPIPAASTPRTGSIHSPCTASWVAGPAPTGQDARQGRKPHYPQRRAQGVQYARARHRGLARRDQGQVS